MKKQENSSRYVQLATTKKKKRKRQFTEGRRRKQKKKKVSDTCSLLTREKVGLKIRHGIFLKNNS